MEQTPTPQPLPGDSVEFSEADYRSEIGNLYSHISLMTKQVTILKAVRDELHQALTATAAERDGLREHVAMLTAEIESKRAPFDEKAGRSIDGPGVEMHTTSEPVQEQSPEAAEPPCDGCIESVEPPKITPFDFTDVTPKASP